MDNLFATNHLMHTYNYDKVYIGSLYTIALLLWYKRDQTQTKLLYKKHNNHLVYKHEPKTRVLSTWSKRFPNFQKEIIFH